MTIPIYGSVGSLFSLWGKLALTMKTAKTYQGSQLTNLTDTTAGVVAQLDAESDIQALVGSSYIAQLNSPGASLGSLCQQVAVQYLNRYAFRNFPLQNLNLQTQNTLGSLAYLINQMQQQGATVLAMTVTATPTSFTGTGNGVLVISTKRPLDGRTVENAYSENLLCSCVTDSYTGNATQGNESFSITGAGSASNVFNFDWPLGSNCSASLNAIDGSQDNASGNVLTNSGFGSWTGSAADNWEATTGAFGTQLVQESGITFGEGSCLALVGDGSTLTSWRQLFGDSDGTSATLSPLTQYAFNVWLRRDGVAAGAGQLAVELVDDGGVVIQDAGGVANQTLINLTGSLTTSFAAYNVAFRTPEVLPDVYYIRYRLTAGNALTNGRTVYLARGGLGAMARLYGFGPYAAVFSGATPFTAGTYATCPVTNSRGAAGTLSTFQTVVFQLIAEMGTYDLLLPSSAAPTIADGTWIA